MRGNVVRSLWQRGPLAVMLGLGLCLAVAGCDSKDKVDPKAAVEPPDTSIKIIASVEVREFEPWLNRAAATAGLELTVEYVGAAELVDRVNQEKSWDAALTSISAYTEAALEKKPVAKVSLFSTNLVVGVKSQRAKDLGWDKATPAWKDVSAAAEAGKFRFAMGAPIWSASGMSAMLSTSLGDPKAVDGVEKAEINEVLAKQLLGGAKQMSTSVSWMEDQFVRENALLDGIVAPEAVVMKVNERMEGVADKLMMVYPTNGSVPLEFSLLHLHAAKKNAFERIAAELRDKRLQVEVVKLTKLRPGVPGVAVATGTPGVTAKQISLEGLERLQTTVVDGLTTRWVSPMTTYLVLPANVASKSVADGEALKALQQIASLTPSTSVQRSAVLRPGERIVLVPYSDRAMDPMEFKAEGESTGQAKDALAKAMSSLVSGEGTALFEGVLAAQRLAGQAIAEDPRTVSSVIVMAERENAVGAGTYAFQKSQEKLGGTRVQVVMFGSANRVEADGVASSTGGRVFQAKPTELGRALLEAREHR